ncbi:MAG: anion transporter, partial [Methanospirillum sp.]|nr:anion transporter [Methanospirillum sp.]
MLAGAVLVLVTGQISPIDALHSINTGVMIFLLSMFIIGEGVLRSGMLGGCLDWICHAAKTGDSLLLLLIFSLGFFSAVFMNDTVAVIATPLVIALADRFSVSRSAAIFALCFSVTTGSVCSPIGNPQNYLIASYLPDMSPF